MADSATRFALVPVPGRSIQRCLFVSRGVDTTTVVCPVPCQIASLLRILLSYPGSIRTSESCSLHLTGHGLKVVCHVLWKSQSSRRPAGDYTTERNNTLADIPPFLFSFHQSKEVIP